MKLTISREALLSPLQAIAGVVERKQTMPILANVLLAADAQGLTLTGTNIEVELVARVDLVQVHQPGRITVPARKLADICKALSENLMVDLSVDGDRLDIRAGSSHFRLSTLPADHFPNVEDDGERFSVQVAQRDLRTLLERTAFAMAQQDVRYYLNGLLIEVTDTHLRAVATDGHRLAMAALPMSTGIPAARQIIVPRKGVQELTRLLGDSESPVELVMGDNHLQVSVGSYTFTSKLIEGKFPDYNRVIPRGGDKVMVAERSLLRSTLQRAAILSHENIRGVRLQFDNGELQVFANNPDQEQAEERLGVDYNGEPLQIGFNVVYLIDVLNAIEHDQVRVTLSGANSSALIESAGDTSGDNVYVVMPMRL